MTTLLAATALQVRRGGREILHGIDMRLDRGEMVVLIGPNGAGKSTALAALAGLVEISGGFIERNGRIATVLQTPALARRSAVANVELAAKWAGVRVRRAERRSRALAVLREVKAETLAYQPAGTLSGGEARRVHLARGLVANPDILFLDEPFAGLDQSSRADLLYDAASALRSPRRGTLIVVHDRAEAWALADRVIVLIDGRIHADGPPTVVFQQPPTEDVAAFVGYVGRLEDQSGVTRLRVADVRISPTGTYRAVVDRRVPVEDGVRLQLSTDKGTIVAVSPLPGPLPGDEVRLDLIGGITFPRRDRPDAGPSRADQPVDGELTTRISSGHPR